MHLFRSQTPRPTRASSSKSYSPHPEIVTQQWSAVKEQVRQGFNTMFEQNNQLESRLNDTIEDNTELQKQIAELKKELEVKNTIGSGNNYALVLVDGDELIFERNFVSDGKSGGMKAAKFFADVAGLSSMLVRGHWLKEVNGMRAFTVGFSDPALGQVDFLDVGSGKDKVAEKFRSEFNWHRNNYNCRSILLGIGHDKGYTRILDPAINQDISAEIQLIERSPLEREINYLKLKKFQCKGVFSSESLDLFLDYNNNTAAKSQSSNEAEITFPTTLPTNPEFEAFQSLKDFEPKPCYNLYLAGSCPKKSCKKGHDYVLNATQIHALATTAKTMRCKYGKA
ncbi:hypothetical protein BDD12DRAFT_864551, partial [Trichophaea hybrida]